MTTTPRVLEFDVTVDGNRTATSALGGSPLRREDEWWAEHLLLASLVRCTLASMDYAAGRAGLEVDASGRAHGTVTRRKDGAYGFTEIEARLDVRLTPPPEPDAVLELVAKAEHGCFVGNSLAPKPRYRWTIDGTELA